MDKLMPIGIQDFKDLRTSDLNYLYIDKTPEVYKLVRSGKVFFSPARAGLERVCCYPR